VIGLKQPAWDRGHWRAANPFGPSVLRIALWALVFGWASWIAFQWLRDAFATPVPEAVVQPPADLDMEAAVVKAATAPVFGEASVSETEPADLASTRSVRLKGVFAGDGGPMAAIINTGKDDEFVLLGKAASSGFVLEGVHPNHIVINRSGVSVRVELEALKSDAARSNSGTAASSARSSHTPSEVPPPPATEPASTAVDAVSPAPLAPPMPQSKAMPDPLSRTWLTDRTMNREQCPSPVKSARVICGTHLT
jgi:type II secretory pathway component PulC